MTSCIEWQGRLNHNGYGTFGAKLAHRLAYEEELGSIPDGLHVLHKCDNRRCINVDHLFLGTNYNNVLDKVSKGRQQRLKGETNGRAQLTNTQVKEIRSRLLNYEHGMVAQLAREYGVKVGVISHIRNGRTWVEGS